jgi:hypothetical protein
MGLLFIFEYGSASWDPCREGQNSDAGESPRRKHTTRTDKCVRLSTEERCSIYKSCKEF